MLETDYKGWKIFEAQTRQIMTNGAPENYTCLDCADKNSPKQGEQTFLTLGGCKGVRMEFDIVEAAKETPYVLFHSAEGASQLIDFIYQDGHGTFHVFQATVEAKRTVDPTAIEKLEEKVGGWEKLNLYYLVPGKKFQGFYTTPVKPRKEGDVWKVLISVFNSINLKSKSN
jgi:hypothetical protein